MPEIVIDLHGEPKLGTVTAVTAKTHRHLRRHGPGTPKNSMEQLPADAEIPSRLRDRYAQGRQDVLPQDLTRMCR